MRRNLHVQLDNFIKCFFFLIFSLLRYLENVTRKKSLGSDYHHWEENKSYDIVKNLNRNLQRSRRLVTIEKLVWVVFGESNWNFFPFNSHFNTLKIEAKIFSRWLCLGLLGVF